MRRSILPALLACMLLTAACAHNAPRSSAVPASPQVEMPKHAETPCSLYTLPAMPTQFDLEVGYSIRGSQVSECDGKRELAVQTHQREHELEAEAIRLREERNRPWWKFWGR